MIACHYTPTLNLRRSAKRYFVISAMSMRRSEWIPGYMKPKTFPGKPYLAEKNRAWKF